MAEDVKLTVGGDIKSGEQALDRVGKKLEETGRTAQQTGRQLSESTKQQGADLEGIGQKSERASGQLMQLAGAIQQVGSGRVDLNSLSNLAKEATGTLGDLGDTLVKFGGGQAAIGGVLHTVSGFLGPAGVLIAGAGALWATWKSFNTEVDETAKKLQAQEKFYRELQKQIKATESAQRDLNEAMLEPNEREQLGQTRSAQQQSIREFTRPGGQLDPALLDLLTGRARLEKNREFAESDAGKKLLGAEKSLDLAIQGLQEKIRDFDLPAEGPGQKPVPKEQLQQQLDELERQKRRLETAATEEGRKTLEMAITDARAMRELYESLGVEERKLIDARTEDIRRQQKAHKLREEELKAEEDHAAAEAERRKKEAEETQARADEWNKMIGEALDVVVQAFDSGTLSLDEALEKVVDKLVEQGLSIEKAEAAELDLRRRFNQRLDQLNPTEGLAGLARAIKEETRIKQEAAQRQQQQAVAAGPAQGGAANAPAPKQAVQGELAGGFNAIFQKLLEQKKQEIGGPLRPDEVQGVRDNARFIVQRNAQRQREELDKKQRDEFDALEARNFGEPGDPRTRNALARRQRIERQALERQIAQQRQADAAAAGGGDQDVGSAVQGMTQSLNQFAGGFSNAMGEIVATMNQWGVTLQNMNGVNIGTRQAAQRIRSQLPGPGASR